MPPRAYYNEPRLGDYEAYSKAFFPEEFEAALAFSNKNGVPYIRNADHLASYIGISPLLVRQICHKPTYHYRKFELTKSDGTKREIQSPKTYLKVIQWWISDNILETSSILNCVHGFRRGRSYFTNAKEHVGAKHLLNVDVKRFFPSISIEMVKSAFRDLGYEENACNLLTTLTTLHDSVPTGAPTSPVIGNIVLREFDREICALSDKMSFRYTRYADDLTFSSTMRVEVDFLAQVRGLIESRGFRLNEKKTKFMGPGNRMEVTGLVINDGVQVPREWRNFARGFLHRVINNPQEFCDKRHVVYGINGTLRAIDPLAQRKITAQAALAVKAMRGGD